MTQNSVVETIQDFSIEPFMEEKGLTNHNEPETVVENGIEPVGENKQRWIPEEDYRLLQYYFKEVGGEPLLSQAEEADICTKIKEYQAKIREIKTLLNRATRQFPKGVPSHRP